ncbi:MAG: hypothetical protein CVU95_04050 [Firmicutes bacterium HGW-Firmicutes-2]|jgi:uncharacterized protein YukE|nr:MAG: hypothetical protein CVU95_04050 [Firmicutes bacterium HGW-Firmicutes-2]
MPDFRVDIDAFTEAMNDYKKAMDEMVRIKENLTEKVDILNNESWRSAAGEKFFALFQNDWADSVDKYNLVIEFMIELLKEAQDRYIEVLEDGEKLIY